MATRLVVAAIAAISALGGAAFLPAAEASSMTCAWQQATGVRHTMTENGCDGRLHKNIASLMSPADTLDIDTGETIVLNAPAAKKGRTARGGPIGHASYEIPAWKADPRSKQSPARQAAVATIQSPFVIKGKHMKPIVGGYRSQGIHDRNAVDLATSCGRAVLAAAEGTVRVANGGKSRGKGRAWNGGYGRYVVIDHADGSQTLYAHLSRILVVVGQFIQQGFPIGLVGSTGHSTGCHVHFEVRGGKNPF